MTDDANRFIHWDAPTAKVKSGKWGKITNQEWCEKTMEEINVRGDGVHIVTNEKGEIALSR